MLFRNDLLAYVEPAPRIIRLLWRHSTEPVAFVIDTNVSDAIPELIQLEILEADLQSGLAQLLERDPFAFIESETLLPEMYKRKRDSAWALIADMVSDEPRIYNASHRSKKIAACVATGLATRPTLYLYLRRFWQRGQTPNALLPDYLNSGGRGTLRLLTSGVKRGRPRKYGEMVGLNVTEEIRKLFSVGVTRYYAMDVRFTLQGAYDQMIKDIFCERNVNQENGRAIHKPKEEFSASGFPSFKQFKYWVEQDNDQLKIKRERLRPRCYDKEMRGLLGTSNAEVWGPGARYQIDATIADVYLVSRIDRSKIIGRPVLYIVIDVFSRMIVGIYVGLEGPSWVGAMMALANTAANKQTFCKAFGKEITAEEWPCHYLPAMLLGDRGEIEGKTIETLINNFNVIVENTAAYRADWKGIVEQRFRLLPAKFKPFVPGYIDVDYRERGGRDYRLDAVLDLDQFTRIIIECVLYFNNNHELNRYDKDDDLAAENFAPVPIDLWEWGITNRSGRLRQYPEELVRFSLLPVDQATITINGIRFKGCFYTCQKAVEERWFDRARQRGTWKRRVSYDPRNFDKIYLHDADEAAQFLICTMTERSRAYRNTSLWEIEQQQESEKQTSAAYQPRQQLASADFTAAIEDIVSAAVIENSSPSTESAASRTKNIRKHRAEEKEANRKSEAFQFPPNTSDPQGAAILLFPTVEQDDYSEPDITEILGKMKREDNEKR